MRRVIDTFDESSAVASSGACGRRHRRLTYGSACCIIQYDTVPLAERIRKDARVRSRAAADFNAGCISASLLNAASSRYLRSCLVFCSDQTVLPCLSPPSWVRCVCLCPRLWRLSLRVPSILVHNAACQYCAGRAVTLLSACYRGGHHTRYSCSSSHPQQTQGQHINKIAETALADWHRFTPPTELIDHSLPFTSALSAAADCRVYRLSSPSSTSFLPSTPTLPL